MAGVCANTRKESAQFSIQIPLLTERFGVLAHDSTRQGPGFDVVDRCRSTGQTTVTIDAFGLSATKYKYNENVVFSHTRAGYLCQQRSSGTRPHGEACGERHGDYSKKRGAQCRERHKESCAHGSVHVDPVIEPVWEARFSEQRQAAARPEPAALAKKKLILVAMSQQPRKVAAMFRRFDTAVAWGWHEARGTV
jgi:hypothetical protein